MAATSTPTEQGIEQEPVHYNLQLYTKIPFPNTQRYPEKNRITTLCTWPYKQVSCEQVPLWPYGPLVHDTIGPTQWSSKR